MQKIIIVIFSFFLFFSSQAQRTTQLSKQEWVDSVFKTLNDNDKISQLIVVRLTSIDTKTGKVTWYGNEVESAIRQYNIGGICLFQGGPVQQSLLVNHLQSIARTPIIISIDAETGLGMRVDSVKPLPRQMMLGAVRDPQVIFDYGQWVGKQCRRMGIHINYAPDVDVNNNPANPVINDRSFGEDKNTVAEYGIMYMKGMQSENIMTCAKHFPGHGDVSVDSHLDLPLITKSREQMDSLELYPFRKIINAGVDAVMVAHLSIPAIDNTANRPSSLSYPTITKLLKEELSFKGIIFTDALEMKGVTKYFPGGEISSEALVAGNDMLCLPQDINGTIEKTKRAIRKKRIRWEDINQRVKKVLEAKYKFGVAKWQPIDTTNIAADLNRESPAIRRRVAEEAITLVKYDDNAAFPLPVGQKNRIAYVALGINKDNSFARRMRSDYNADVFYFDYTQDSLRINSLVYLLETRYDAVVIGVHQLRRFPAGNFGLSEAAVKLVNSINKKVRSTIFVFGNPYAIKNFCQVENIIACYEDESIIQETAADMLNGHIGTKGRLPVTVCPELPAGTGIQGGLLQVSDQIMGIQVASLGVIDSIANDAIRQHATPGCVVLVAKDGKIAYYKGFGYYTYDSTEKVTDETIYDLASVTKICATTLCVMKLYDQGKLNLDKTLGDYLPWVRGSDKQDIVIRDVLLHQARLKSYIPFYRETIDTLSGIPFGGWFSKSNSSQYSLRVADSMYMRNNWRDTMFSRILSSPLEKPGQYIYSDNDFIFLGLIVEALTGMKLDEFAKKQFYEPLGLVTTGFHPRDRFALSRIAPTENEQYFRRQLIRGDVHDPGAAMFGGVAGHAGLFSNAYDIAVIMQMLLNKGVINGRRFLSDTTILRFTSYGSSLSRRGLGFDKPEKDNDTRKEAYPTLSASPLTFGHTGFTGIGVWADPRYNLIYIILSNRVNPDGSTKFLKMNVRPSIQEAIYKALE
jgi:beta-N-acetylhexosaminidase